MNNKAHIRFKEKTSSASLRTILAVRNVRGTLHKLM